MKLRPGTKFNDVPHSNSLCLCRSGLSFQSCCQGKLLLIRKHVPGSLYFVNIGGLEIYRPSPDADQAIRNLAEPAIRKTFSPGRYDSESSVKEILFKQVETFGDRFDALIPLLASREFLSFLLWQYDRADQLDTLLHRGFLRGEAMKEWLRIGPTHMRALKYIAERITMLAPESPPNEPSIEVIDETFICAEELINYCITADLSRLYPESTCIVIQDEGRKTYSDHSISNAPTQKSFYIRISRDVKFRSEFFKTTNFSSNLQNYSDLDGPLLNLIGLTYQEILGLLSELKTSCKAVAGDPMNEKFVLRVFRK